MLRVYDSQNSNNVIPIIIPDSDRFTTFKYGGFDTLTFEINANNENYKYIAEEVIAEDENNRYIIKKVDEHSGFATISCELDLDDWKVNIINNYRKTNYLLSQALNDIVPNGWTIEDAAQFTTRKTIEQYENEPFKGVTAFDLIEALESVYDCVFKFDTVSKIIYVLDINTFTPTGNFFTDELNLKSFGFNGDSSNFATRLYAKGAVINEETGEQLTFASINDGKDYVDDNSYSDKIISVFWSDERYTVKEDLLRDAKAKLKELAFPVRAYSCESYKLGEGIWLYEIITLIDRVRKTRVNHRIVEYKHYPNYENDTVTLSAVTPKIESSIKTVISDTVNERINEQKPEISKEIIKGVEDATAKITGSSGGYFVWRFDDDGRPVELYNLGDTKDINTAQKIWRWNKDGLAHSNNGINGPYTLAILADGTINAEAILTNLIKANQIDIDTAFANAIFAQNITATGTISGAILRSTDRVRGGIAMGMGTLFSQQETYYDGAPVWTALRILAGRMEITETDEPQDEFSSSPLDYLWKMSITARNATFVRHAPEGGYGGGTAIGAYGLQIVSDDGTLIALIDRDDGDIRLNGDTSVKSLSSAGAISEGGTVLGNKYAAKSHTHNSILDVENGTATKFAYSKDGLNYGDYEWLAGWNGYELRAVNKNQFATAIHAHDYLPSGGTAVKASALVDVGNNNLSITAAYSKSGLNYGDYEWLAGWNGYELRAVNKNQFLPSTGGTITGGLTVNGTFQPQADIRSQHTYDSTVTNSPNMYITTSYNMRRTTSSSRRYKTDIVDLPMDDIRGLYRLPVRLFRYKPEYTAENDERHEKQIPGFIAEEVEEILPIAVDHVNGQAEMWNSNVIVPCLLKLIQDLNNRIENQENKINKIENALKKLGIEL